MITGLIMFLQDTILPLGAFGVFLGSIIEEVIAPIPSAAVITTAGFIFVAPEMTLASFSTLIFKVAIPAGLGVTIGSLFVYYLAVWGGRFAIDKYGKYIGLYYKDIDNLQKKLEKSNKDEIGVLIARVIPIIPSVAISAFCGIVKMRVLPYCLITFVGTTIRATILGILGSIAGGVYFKYSSVISKFESFTLYLIIILVIGFVIYKYKTNKKDSK